MMEHISETKKAKKPVELLELEALLSLLEFTDLEQINPAHHYQVVRLCSKKLRAVSLHLEKQENFSS